MSWLSKIFKSQNQKKRSISFDEKDFWIIDLKESDISLFIKNLEMFFLKEAIIYIEGGSINFKIQEYLDSVQVDVSKIANIQRGTIWPKPKIFHIPLESSVLQKLSEFTDDYDLIELCEHLVIYKDKKILMAGYDIFDEKIYLSGQIEENLIRDFCDKIGGDYYRGPN